MVMQAQPKPTPGPALPRPELRLIESGRGGAQLHLFTFLVGNALFWTLLGALSISTDRWYWWPALPFAAWALVLTLHFWHVHRSARG